MNQWLGNIILFFLHVISNSFRNLILNYKQLLKQILNDIGSWCRFTISRAFFKKAFFKYTPYYLIILSSCEEAIDYEYQDIALNNIVVNCKLTNESKSHQVIINLPVKQLNEKPEPVTGAFVGIYDGDSLHELHEDVLAPGTYRTDNNFRSVINRVYTLAIIANGKRYYASSYMLPVTPFTPLKYKLDENENLFTIDSVNEVFNKNESAIYEIQIDWTNVPGYENIDNSHKKAILYYYTLSTIDISELFAPKKETVFFPAGTTIVESKYSVTPEHASFIRSMLLETEWRGGLFDVSKGNVKSNISDGGFGYFSVSTVIRDTIIVR